MLEVAVVLAVLTLVCLVFPPRMLLTSGLLCWSLNVMSFLPIPGIASLLAGFLLLTVASAKRRRGSAAGESFSSGRIVSLLFAFALLGAALSPLALDPMASALSSAELLLFAVVILSVTRSFPFSEVLTTASRVLMGLGALSLVAALIGNRVNESGRWIGVTENPNSLGLLAGVLVCLSAGMGTRFRALAIPLGVLLLWFSGSRGSALATVSGLAWASWVWASSGGAKGGTRRVVGIFAILATSAAVILFFSSANLASSISDSSLGRTEDSGRLQVMRAAWDLFLQRPLTGYGAGVATVGETSGAHVFPVTLAVQFGVFGLMLFGALVLMLLRTEWRSIPMLGPLVVFALTSMISESWLLGGGTIWTLAFWLVIGSQRGDVQNLVSNASPRKTMVGQDARRNMSHR